MNVDLYGISNYLYNYLIDYGIEFNQYGYPIIPDECILREEPEKVLPYKHRNACENPGKTVICYFANDEQKKLWKNSGRIISASEIFGQHLGLKRRQHKHGLQNRIF